MKDSFAQLIEDVEGLEEMVYPESDPDFAAAFGDRVRALGERALLVYLFRNFADSRLSVLLAMLRFAWSEFSFETWLSILEEVADDRRVIYQLLAFFGETLAIDVQKLTVAHPNIKLELASSAFRDGAFRPRSRTVRARLEDSFDYERLWSRLASEGAPLQPLPQD